MKPKRTVSGYILLVGIMGLSIVGGVLAFQIFRAMTKTQVTSEQSSLIKSLDGSIDPKAITNLKGRMKFSSSELNTVVNQPSVTPSVTPGVSPSVNTPTITPSVSATTGGNIVVTPSVSGASPSATTQ